MKLEAIKILGGKCSICGYDRCIDALEFHHENPEIKEFKLGSGNTMSWKEYKREALKCILVCSNCHKEIHSKIGYKGDVYENYNLSNKTCGRVKRKWNKKCKR